MYILKTWHFQVMVFTWFLHGFLSSVEWYSWVWIFLTFIFCWSQHLWRQQKPFQTAKICHPHFLVFCSNQETDSTIKLLLTSLYTRELFLFTKLPARCEFCKIFKNNFFTEHLRTTASVQRAFGFFHIQRKMQNSYKRV